VHREVATLNAFYRMRVPFAHSHMRLALDASLDTQTLVDVDQITSQLRQGMRLRLKFTEPVRGIWLGTPWTGGCGSFALASHLTVLGSTRTG
jgi:hypothetical protein